MNKGVQVLIENIAQKERGKTLQEVAWPLRHQQAHWK